MASKGIEEFVRRLRKQGYRMEVTPETDSHSSTYTKNKSAKSNSKGGDSFLGYTAERTWDNFKDVFKNIHKNAQINASAGYGEDVLKQLDKLKESSAGKGWNKKGIEQLEQAFRPSIEQTRKEKDERGIEEIKRVQQNQNELDANIEQKYSGLTENQKKWGNRIASIGSVLPSALAYAVPGGQAVSAGVTFGNISGDAIGNALLEGKTPREAQSYGYLEGLKEAAVEQAFGGVAGLSKKAGLSKGLNALLDNKVSNRAARTLLSRTGAATGEGLEEVVSTLAEPLVRKASFSDEELQNVSLDDLKEAFLGGATAAAILGTGQDAINSVRNKRSITKIANQTGRTKEEVKNSLNNFNTVEARDVVKALDPADFEPKLSTIENMQRYAKEIDDVFTGKAKDGSFIELGETPAILQRLGAKPHKLTMTQDTARKIAYPEGYKIGGKSMGGKHNLGIPALKQLPAQLENPMAVLKSKTQPNSFVVLTNWKLDDGRTVVTPIHLDKQGRITIDNRVVSTYGKDVNKLLGENDENVLWRKNDRSIDQLLGERLQLPMASSDDASSIYNMPQGENYVNREIADNTEIDYNKLKGGRNDEASIDLRTREIYGRGMDGGLDSAAYASEGTQGRRGDSQESIYGAAKPGNAELYGHLRMEQDGGRIHGLGSITTEDPVVHQALIQNNAAAFPMRSDVSGVAFFDAINKVKSENKHGAYVTAYEPADYDGFRTLFLDESGLSGVGVKQDGDIVSVFNSPNSPHTHAVTNLLLNALDAGGNKLDNFDGKLSDFYAKHGFIPVARVAFDRN